MNEAIVERWNSIVKPGDMVIHLGDVMLNDDEQGIKYFKQLNGTISIIWGNHETDRRKKIFSTIPNVISLGYAHQFRYKKFSIYLSHYPTFTANFDDKYFNQHVINLHGHTHSKTNWIIPTNPFMYHVGMDSHNCTPVHIEEILSDIKAKYEMELMQHDND